MPTLDGTSAANRNVRLLYAFSACMQLQPHIAIWVVYLTGFRDLTLAQVGTLEAFFWTVSVLAEMPTGAFSDRYGRRLTFLAGAVIEALGVLSFALASSYPVLLLSYVLWSVGLAFGSGNAPAFLYDSLASDGRAADFVRFQGRLSAITRGAFLAGAIAGGLIAGATTTQIAIFAGVLPYLLAIAIATRMADPPRAREESLAEATASYRGTLVRALRVLRRDPAVRWLIVATVALDALLVADWLLMQPYFESHGIPLALFGLLAAPVRIVAMAASLLAHRYVAFTGFRRGLGAMVVAITLGVVLIGVIDHRASFAGYLLLAGGLGLIDPAVIGYLNDRVPRAIRATVLSVPPLGRSLAFAVVGTAAGVAADSSVRLAFVLLGAGAFVLAGSAYLLWLRADAASPLAPSAEAPAPGGDERTLGAAPAAVDGE